MPIDLKEARTKREEKKSKFEKNLKKFLQAYLLAPQVVKPVWTP